jgi:predicted CXXCH cytochrome family protein
MRSSPSPSRHRVLFAVFASIGLVMLAYWLWWSPFGWSRRARGDRAPGAGARAAYVDNARCVSCHEPEARAWRDSHHARAMAPPAPESVHGDFGDTEFRYEGVTTRFHRRGGKYLVTTEGPDGQPGTYEVAFTFGEAPLQQYLIAMPGGRLQPLQVAWDREKRRWFRLLPGEQTPPGDVLHWTGRYQTANTMCLSCHTTGYEKRYIAERDSFDSHWTESNVSCQSCHGPGERHVKWASGGARAATGSAPRGLLVDARAADPARRVELCAPCHSRRSELTTAAVPGEPLLDHHLPSLLQPGLYHADGQQLDEVFEYGSYRQSRMYQKGVTCTDCHEPHGGKLRAEGDALCLSCHGPRGNPAFPTAAGRFASPAHHFHEQGSAGSACVSCHMPARNYMVVQPRRDHSIRVPRPDLTVKLGAPNACNDCHADRSAAWAAERAAAWWGTARRSRAHPAEAFAAARSGSAGAVAALAALVASDTLPGIVRASALEALRAEGSTALDARIAATRDPDAEVRAAAATSLESAPAAERLSALVPQLEDPVRAVRIGAARALSTLPAGSLPAPVRRAFDAALAEYVAAQHVSLDMPAARLNLAVVLGNSGQTAESEQQYLAALRIDPDFTPARANLAHLYNATDRNADAIRVLEVGLARVPAIGELHYSLGLLYAEEQRLPDAARSLAQAAQLMPERARVRYNLGLVLQQLGRGAEAEAELRAAARLEPNGTDALHALAVLYAQRGDLARARELVARLRQLEPLNPDWVQLEGRLGR